MVGTFSTRAFWQSARLKAVLPILVVALFVHSPFAHAAVDIQGIDISHWQGNLTPSNWTSIKNAGYKFVMMKATQGVSYVDPTFDGPDADNFDAYLDLFESYKSTEDAAFPRAAVGPDNRYYGFSTNYQAFIVNTKMMPLDKAPKSWTDLAKPEFKGKILMANPAQSGSAYSQMHQILMLYGWDLWTKIIQNAVFVPSSKLAFQNVAKGEIPVGLTSEFNILVSKLEGNPVEAVYPSDGTALIIDANGIIKGGPNPENARKFIDFISSAGAHKILVDLDKRRSARKDVTPPPGLADAKGIKTFAYDTVGAAKDRTQNLEKFDKIFSAK